MQKSSTVWDQNDQIGYSISDLNVSKKKKHITSLAGHTYTHIRENSLGRVTESITNKYISKCGNVSKFELIYSSSFSATGSVLYPASTKNPKLWQLSEQQSSALAQISLTPGLFMHKIWGAGMAQWERSPPTNASRVRFPDPAFVVGSLPCSERFFSRYTPVFPSPQKPTFPNSNSIWIIVKHFITSLWLRWSRKHSLCLTLN